MSIRTGQLNGVEIHWAAIREPSTMSGKYEVEIHNLTKEQVDYINKLAEGKPMWTTVRTSEKYPEKGKFIKIKCGKPPRVMDSNKKPIPSNVLLGNGTIATVGFLITEPASPQGVKKVKLTLTAILVQKLVKYQKDDLEAVAGGYSIEEDEDNNSLDNGTLEEVN